VNRFKLCRKSTKLIYNNLFIFGKLSIFATAMMKYLLYFFVLVAQTPFLVFSGTNSRYLAEKICNSLGCPLGQMNIQHFADGEFSVSYEESIRGRDVFLVQSTFPNSDNLMELLLMIDAAKRASAHSIIAVVPYFGWARQDRKG